MIGADKSEYRAEGKRRPMGWMKMEGKTDFSGLHLLITDDNRLYGELIAELLSVKNAKVSLARSGAEAVRMLRDGGTVYDAVLMDVLMPEMNGYEATRAIRKLDKAHNGQVPVFAMTAGSEEAVRQHAREAGMDAYLGKPVNLAALDEALGAVLAKAAG